MLYELGKAETIDATFARSQEPRQEPQELFEFAGPRFHIHQLFVSRFQVLKLKELPHASFQEA